MLKMLENIHFIATEKKRGGWEKAEICMTSLINDPILYYFQDHLCTTLFLTAKMKSFVLSKHAALDWIGVENVCGKILVALNMQPDPAVVAEWSKTLISLIQVGNMVV